MTYGRTVEVECPCNVVVQEAGGKTIVSTIDARAMLSIAGNPALMPVADAVNERLQRVLDTFYRGALARSRSISARLRSRPHR